MSYWKKYDIRSSDHSFLLKYMQKRKPGVKGWFKNQICRRWHGEHDFYESTTKYPTPFRKKVCKRCGAIWYYSMPIPPPMGGHVYVECPRCLDAVMHKTDNIHCDCRNCGKVFKYEDF